MSLNWNLTNVKDKDVCWEMCEQDDLGTGRKAGEKYMRGTTNSLIWMTMALGMDGITPKNFEEFWWRLGFYETLHGPFNGVKKMTKTDVVNHIGLDTNVSQETRPAWIRRTLKYWKPTEQN